MQEKIPTFEFIYENSLCYPQFNLPKLSDLESNIIYAPILVSFDERYKFKYVQPAKNRTILRSQVKIKIYATKPIISPSWNEFEAWLVQIQSCIRRFLVKNKFSLLNIGIISLKTILNSINSFHLDEHKLSFIKTIQSVKFTQANFKAIILKNEFNILLDSIKFIQFNLFSALHLNQKKSEFISFKINIQSIQLLLHVNKAKDKFEKWLLLRNRSALFLQKLYRGNKSRANYYKSCELELKSLYENVLKEWNLKNTSWLYRANFIMSWFPLSRLDSYDYLFKKSSDFKPLVINRLITPWALYISAYKSELNRLKNLKSDTSTHTVYLSNFFGSFNMQELSSRDWLYIILKAIPEEKRNYLHSLFKINVNDKLRKQKLLDAMFSEGIFSQYILFHFI